MVIIFLFITNLGDYNDNKEHIWMVKEFNLSEKIQDHCDECCSEMIDIIDIKEFIKRLKDEINQFPNRDDKLGARILMPDGGGVDR
ncbi:hypothetical protein LCGC14_2815420, partial [marine sediment metagenome]